MLLADRYRLDMPLGYGRMGEVWMAADERLNRPVAVRLLTGLAKSDDRARFHREARIAARLDHPRIVTVHDFGISDDCCFLTTEWVNGSSLAHELLHRGPLGPAQVASSAAQAAEGLAEAHRQGVVHGDVKPSNLLLDENGMVKIADFGVAWCPGSQATYTTATGLVGTSRYRAPEAARGEETEAHGDVYALGCTLYELLTGSPPFTAERHGTVPCRDLPDSYGDILLRMLAESPQERPEAREVADWFTRASARANGQVADRNSGGESGLAKRTTMAGRTDPVEETVAISAGAATDTTDLARRRRRWPAVAGAVTTAAALTAGVVALTTPTTGGAPGAGSSPRPAVSEATVPGPANARGAGLQTPWTQTGTSSGQQPSSQPQTSAGSDSRPAVAGSTAPGPLSPTSAGHTGLPTAAPTTAPPSTRPASPTPSPSTSPSPDPSPTTSSPSDTTGEAGR
jgi:eukaryotic-like serine/threonine-protein kinase